MFVFKGSHADVFRIQYGICLCFRGAILIADVLRIHRVVRLCFRGAMLMCSGFIRVVHVF